MKKDVLAVLSIIAVLCAMAFAYVQLSSGSHVVAEASKAPPPGTGAAVAEASSGIGIPSGSVVASSTSPASDTLSQLSMDERAKVRLAELDDKLRSEPYSPDWARSRQAEIDGALSLEVLAEFAGPAPSALEVSCRSATCRISMKFEDVIAAGNTVTALTAGIAEHLPNAVIVPVSGGSEGIEYHVFAMAPSASGPTASPYPG